MIPAIRKGAILALAVTAAAVLIPAHAYTETSDEVYRAIGVKARDVITGTILTAAVRPGGGKQLVTMTTYFTGKKDRARAVNVMLTVFLREEDKLVSIYSRDYGLELDGYVGRGEIELIDLDGDGLNEVIATYDDHRDPLVRVRVGEVIVLGEAGFRIAWSGTMEYDATRDAREVPMERRDRYVREIDIRETLRSRGVTLFLNKRMIAVAGERLPEPKTVRETFPLKPSESRW